MCIFYTKRRNEQFYYGHSFHTEMCALFSAKNGSVPVFYHRVLQELKADLQTMTSDLQNVANTQVAVNDVDPLVQASTYI